MSSNLKANCYRFATGCRNLYLPSVGCRKAKMVGKHCWFTIWVCHVTLALMRLHSRVHTCIHDASGQRDAVEQIAADRLPIFQREDSDRIWWSCYALLD